MKDSEIARLFQRAANVMMFAEEISKQHNCNDCGKLKNCEYRPDWGEPVRINCPLWAEEKVEREAFLISRQAALDELRAMQTYKLGAGDDMLLIDQAEAMTKVMMLPPAEPERKRGKWLMAGEDEREQIVWVECSECGQALSWNSNYCPNCGADLRGEQDG